jgi:predicted nuclease with RNAse H fold
MSGQGDSRGAVVGDLAIGVVIIAVLAFIVGGVAIAYSEGETYASYAERGEASGRACATSAETFEDVLSCADICAIDDGTREAHAVWQLSCQTGFMREITSDGTS